METKRGNNIREMSHLLLVVTITVFSLVLVILNIMLGWEKWTIPMLLAFSIVCFAMHIKGRPSERIRISIYCVILMMEMFYYCANVTTIYDCTPVVLMTLILVALTQEKVLLVLCVLIGYLGMFYHLIMSAIENGFVLMYLSDIVRTIWHLVLVMITATIITRLINAILRMNRDFHEKVKDLEAVNRSASDFLANVSHEIRTPINAVIGLTGVCLERDMDEEMRTDLNSVQAAGKRIAEQISDILDYSEIDMDSLAVNSEDYMLSSVLNDLVNQIAPEKPKELELVIDVEPSIPSVMHTDVSKLKKILWHLIGNSLKYTSEGGVYVHISSIKQSYGVNLIIEVTDTGVGMNAEELERVTERFYQANSGRTRSASGLGLGMSIVSGFVSALQGFMTIESVPNEGTTVRVSIPQRVVNGGECMSIRDRKRLCLGALLHFEKFPNAHVREYYNRMMRNIVAGLHVQMHRVETVDNLKKLQENVTLTHLFVGVEEYREDAAYLEKLAKEVLVVVVCDHGFRLPTGSHIRLIRKPFYCFPVTTVLNMDVGDLDPEEGRLTCPGIRALVVDDEPMNLTVSTGIFSRYGMVVTTADSGYAALDLCKECEFDIIFMDHMMPGMDGVETMKRIRSEQGKNRSEVPIVALTANAVSTAREMFISEGFDAFVSKPIELIELERALRKVLPKSRIIIERFFDRRETASEVDERPMESKQEEKPEEGKEDQFVALCDLSIDPKKGLHYCQQDEDFYRTLLQQYAKDGEKKKADADHFFEAGDLANYAIVVHSVKSTSKMIGALSLSDEAAGLETAAKDGNSTYILENHAAVMTEYEKVIRGLFAFCDSENKEDMQEDEILEFDPSGDPEGSGGAGEDDILEFAPEEEEILEFAPVAEDQK